MKKLFIACALVPLALAFGACEGSKDKKPAPAAEKAPAPAEPAEPDDKGGVDVTGDITVDSEEGTSGRLKIEGSDE